MPDSFQMPVRAPEGGHKGKGFLELWFGRDEANEGKTRPAPYLRLAAVIPFLIPLMGTIAFTPASDVAARQTAMFLFAPAMQPFRQLVHSVHDVLRALLARRTQ